MSKRVLAILLAMLLAAGIYSAVANAGVEGDFTFDIWMWPQTTAVEASDFEIDFEALLNLNFTLSGLTVGNKVAMGIAGLEHYILTFDTVLGALNLSDTFAFAAPFIECPYYKPAKYWYIDFFYAYPAFTSCHPIGELMFVKKRVSLEMLLGGLTLETLIMFEDVNFPNPINLPTTLMPVDPADGVTMPGPAYDESYTTDDQVFRFGGILGISGTTVSGIEITAKSGLCADWSIFPGYYPIGKFSGGWMVLEYTTNVIKKYMWYETVCWDGELALTKEFISITNLGLLPNLVLNSYLIMMPFPDFTFNSFVEAVYTLPMGLGTLYSWFHFGADLAISGPYSNFMYLALDNLDILWVDYDGDMTLSIEDAVTAAISFDLQAASFLFQTLYIPTLGIYSVLFEVDLPLSYPEQIGMLEVTALWEAGPVAQGFTAVSDGLGPVVWEAVDFHLTKNFGEHNTLGVDAQFGVEGLRAVEVELGVSWSL